MKAPSRARLALVACWLAVGSPLPAASDGLSFGAKNFEENRLLAEIAAQLVEARLGVPVERELGLAGTQVAFEALRAGAIDLYPEYTGTGLVSILGREPVHDRAVALRLVRREFLERWDLWWLAPLGFENSFEIAVPRRLAQAEGLQTLSDLARVAPRLRAGFGYEFVERPDGLPGLAELYGLRFAEVRSLQQGLKYRAAASGDVQALDVYTTDGRLLTYDLAVLEDDRSFFPPYEAVLLVRGEALRETPGLAATLALLGDVLDEETMRGYNLALQEGGETEAAVAKRALADLGLVVEAGSAEDAGTGGRRGLLRLLWEERVDLGRLTLEHLGMSAAALGLGVLVAVPLGLALERRRRWGEPAVRALAVTQTVPSIALLAFMIPLFGIGLLPALVALWIYSLFPIVRTTYTGVLAADPAAVAAATALGMTPTQVLLQVRLPLAAPVILAGVRTAAVLTVGTATLAAFIGAGGLGEPIVTGLQVADTARILSGALPAALLAIVVDRGLAWVEALVRPRGLNDD